LRELRWWLLGQGGCTHPPRALHAPAGWSHPHHRRGLLEERTRLL
jgi:hypothetical protein